MPQEDANEFFGHLDQPAAPRRTRRPSSGANARPGDYESVPDPFEDPNAPLPPEAIADSAPRSVLSERGRVRTRPQQPQGPGLSPGVPVIRESGSPTRKLPNSGVVLTPSGVKRVADEPPRPPSRPAARRPELPPEPEEPADYYEASREQNDQDDVSWEEYAAEGFPAMPAEEFGVKTKTTDSGRMVPVAVRSDLTDEAIKGKSVKGGGRKPRPVNADAPQAPKSFWGKVGDSLRMKKPVLDDDDNDASPATGKTKGFAKSGSLPAGKKPKTRKTPLGVAWSVCVEVMKILALVLLLRAYVLQVSQVKGPSMEGTLLPDDRLVVERVTPSFVNNADKWWVNWLPDFLMPELTRGDIIVIRSPEDPGAELVKRLIGLPGDTIKFEDGKLWLKPAGANDFELVNEDYLSAESLKNEDGTFDSYERGNPGRAIDEGEPGILVPQDRIFVLGDNRGKSNDSRAWLEIEARQTEGHKVDRLWVHKASVEGRVVLRLWPLDRVWPPVK